VRQLETEDHWPLVDLVAIVSREQKPVPSEQGHLLAWTSPLLKGRLVSLGSIVRKVKRAIREKDLPSLGQALESDALCMHAVMMTSHPALLYWVPATVAVIKAVRRWRTRKGLDCYFTIDAGPNVHVITLPEQAGAVSRALKRIKGVQEVLRCSTGRGAYLVEDEHLR
jgi:diphosphomevalonate decarboxylase